jgi:tetratricopeptide (TPR) repeat protein
MITLKDFLFTPNTFNDMKSFLSKLSIVMITIGFIAACGGDPNIESAKLNLNRGDYQQVLESANAALETNPDNALGYYYRGVAYSEMGKAKPYNQREENYADAGTNFDKAVELFTAQGKPSASEVQLMEIQRTQLWALEYNSAVTLVAPEEGEPSQQDLSRASNHLLNAYAIQSDSLQTIDVLSEVYFMMGDLPNAIKYMEMAIDNATDNDTYRYLRLNYFLAETDQQDRALEMLNDALAKHPGDIELTQEVANVYLALGKTDEALEIIRVLINRNPENAQYRLVFGSQVYQFVMNMGDDLRSANETIIDKTRELRLEERKQRPDPTLISQIQNEIADAHANVMRLTNEINIYTQQAEDELVKASELDNQNPIIFNTLGIIYQNRAANLFDRRNATENIQEADKFDEEARAMLTKSLPYYERAAELDVDNTDYWMSLFRIYTTLGMTEKALEAQEKAGL